MKAEKLKKLIEAIAIKDDDLKLDDLDFGNSFYKNLLVSFQKLNLTDTQIEENISIIYSNLKTKVLNKLTNADCKNKMISDFKDKIARSEITIENSREVNKVDWYSRRFDILARILAPKESYSACLAVALYDNKFIVSFNSSNNKDVTNEMIQEMTLKKIGILRDCILKMQKESNNATLDKKKFNEISNDVYVGLKEFGEFVANLPSTKSTKYASNEEYYKKKIAKLLYSFIKKTTQDGFSELYLHTFLTAPITFLSPRANRIEHGGSLHAEQMIAHYLSLFGKKLDVYIGISKLCCANCNEVLKDFATLHGIKFRGTHGGLFPNVMDIRTSDKFNIDTTKLRMPAPGSDLATDSGSIISTTAVFNIMDSPELTMQQPIDHIDKGDNQNYEIIKKEVKKYKESGSQSEEYTAPVIAQENSLISKRVSSMGIYSANRDKQSPSSSGDTNDEEKMTSWKWI